MLWLVSFYVYSCHHSCNTQVKYTYIVKYSYILIICFFQTVELAKSYYSCESIEGLSLENEGGGGTARWEFNLLLSTELRVSMTIALTGKGEFCIMN